MRYTPTEQKAIKLWSEENNCTPQLSARPIVTFKYKDGRIITRTVSQLVSYYKAGKKL